MLYHSQHPDQWQWFQNPHPGSSSSWPGNLLEAMYPIYKDEKYSNYVKEVRPLIYPNHHFAWTFPTLMKPYLTFK